jgi:hypothetical protein
MRKWRAKSASQETNKALNENDRYVSENEHDKLLQKLIAQLLPVRLVRVMQN